LNKLMQFCREFDLENVRSHPTSLKHECGDFKWQPKVSFDVHHMPANAWHCGSSTWHDPTSCRDVGSQHDRGSSTKYMDVVAAHQTRSAGAAAVAYNDIAHWEISLVSQSGDGICNLAVTSCMTVDALKRLVQHTIGMKLSCQRLHFEGTFIDGDVPLEQYGISNGARLSLSYGNADGRPKTRHTRRAKR